MRKLRESRTLRYPETAGQKLLTETAMRRARRMRLFRKHRRPDEVCRKIVWLVLPS